MRQLHTVIWLALKDLWHDRRMTFCLVLTVASIARQLHTVIWLALKDLWHDRRMTFCLVLTVASIALPLLLFLGIKSGAMQVLRQRMLNDPVYMEILPQGRAAYDAAWFRHWGAHERVGFVGPRTRMLGGIGSFRASPQSEGLTADMLPSGPGDWLLQSYGVAVPQGDSCVLSWSLAQKLNVTQGQTVQVEITRQNKGQGKGLEAAQRQFVIQGVLPPQASGRELALIPLDVLERMEDFHDGRAVPAYGWEGERLHLPPIFYEVLLHAQQTPTPVLLAQIHQNAGLGRPLPLKEKYADAQHTLRLSSGMTPIDGAKFNALYNTLRGQDMQVTPLSSNGADTLRFFLHLEGQQQPLTVASPPLWAEQPDLDTLLGPDWQNLSSTPPVVLLSPRVGTAFSQSSVPVRITAGSQGHAVELPLYVRAHDAVPEGLALVTPGLLGALNHLHQRPLFVGPPHAETGHISLLPGRRNHPWFRMYAKSLEDVSPLAAELEAQGITVKTRADEIERVRSMDHYLSLMLLIITTGSICGGIVCLLSSLYANVERKRRELAVLRLLGVHGGALCAFPLTAGLVMTFLGLLLALLAFHALALSINMVAVSFTLAGETLCLLTAQQQLSAVLISLGAAMLAALGAALRLVRVQTAECLRDE